MRNNDRNDLIAFHTTSHLRNALEQTAALERRSLSQVIEGMLADGLRARRLVAAKDRRRYRREKLSLKATVWSAYQPKRAATIVDISLSGMKIRLERSEAGANGGCLSSFVNVTFALPGQASEITMVCRPERTEHVRGCVETALSFENCNFGDYRKLQSYLGS